MNTHKNAHLTPKDRDAMVRAFVAGGLTKAVAPRQQERVHADHRDDASARTNVSAVRVLMVLELCRPILRADSRLYHLGLDVVSFQVEPRDPRVFGRRLHRYHLEQP